MARILFLSDFAQGHLLPTFGVARGLQKRGHRVGYAVIPDLEPAVRWRGFDPLCIFGDLYPAGTLERLKEDQSGERLTVHLDALIGGALDPVVEAWRPDLIIVSYFLSLEALILETRYGVPITIFTCSLRPAGLPPADLALEQLVEQETVGFRLLELAVSKGRVVRKMRQLVEPLERCSELLFCPPEFEVEQVDRGPRVQYVEPSIRRDETRGPGGRDPSPVLRELGPGEELVYASLGSAVETHREIGERFYRALFELAGSMPARFVLSLGSGYELGRLGTIPDNVKVYDWVPQMAVLERSRAAITHGGLGTVKECIWHGVPMVVLPAGRDQPLNAERVEHHRLGRTLDPSELTAETLAGALRHVLESPEVARGIAGMMELFRRREAQQLGAAAVEEILASPVWTDLPERRFPSRQPEPRPLRSYP
jgi:MGT family glycosyltransferase